MILCYPDESHFSIERVYLVVQVVNWDIFVVSAISFIIFVMHFLKFNPIVPNFLAGDVVVVV